MTTILSRALRRCEEFRTAVSDLAVTSAPEPDEIRDHLQRRYSFEAPIDDDALVDDVAEMLERWAVHVVHPRYFGYFNPTPLPAAVAADLMTAAYNPQLAVWSHAPAAVEIEQHVLRWLMESFGLPPGEGGAHFTTGGSEANLTAIVAALTDRVPGYGERGLADAGVRPSIYRSAGAHDSFTKICHMTGVGREALRVVPVDRRYRMDVGALERRLDEDRRAGWDPLLVVATAGTTAAGVIDPLDEVALLCRDRGLWLHVDAAWGGAAVLSPALRGHLRGIERADSITCDAHKWLNVTMGAGIFLCRDRTVLEKAFRVTTDYMPPARESGLDPYVTSVQWSRRFIGLKLFMSLASLGEAGYAGMIEDQAGIGRHMARRLEEEGWIHVTRSPFPVCCVTHPRIESGEVALDDVLARVLDGGRAWISRVRLGDREALRACVTSYRTSEEDVEVLVTEMGAALDG